MTAPQVTKIALLTALVLLALLVTQAASAPPDAGLQSSVSSA